MNPEDYETEDDWLDALEEAKGSQLNVDEWEDARREWGQVQYNLLKKKNNDNE